MPKRRELSRVNELARRSFAYVAAKVTPRQLVTLLELEELRYLCEVCSELNELGICEQLWFDDDAPDEEDD